MRRWVYAYRAVPGDPEQLEKALRSRLVGLLGDAASRRGDPASRHVDGSTTLRLDAPVPGAPAKTIRVTTGVAARRDGRLHIPLRWHAEPARHAFPEFDGALELEPLSARLSQLTVVGGYMLPLGALGAAVDSTLLAGAAQRTADRLAARLADALAAAAGSPPPRGIARVGREARVGDVMTDNPVVLDPGLPLRAAALLLFHRGIRGAPAVAGDGELVGVLSETDVLRHEAGLRPGAQGLSGRRREPHAPATVGQACSRPARITVPDASLRDAAQELLDRSAGRLVVVDGASIVGIVTRHDVLSSLIRTDVQLDEAIDTALMALGEPTVTAEVRWGEARISGDVSKRSRALKIAEAIAKIDGVTGVEDDLDWLEDDISSRRGPVSTASAGHGGMT